MRTIPAEISGRARDGQPIYLVVILPGPNDTWPAFRWGERQVTLDGVNYEGGILAPNAIAQPITQKANLEFGGGAATTDSLAIKLLDKVQVQDNTDKKPLRELLIDRPTEGRQITVGLIMAPLNLVKNSNFEKRTVDDFDDWTETPGTGTITAETTTVYQEATACRIAGDTVTPPFIQSATFDFEPGAYGTVSFWARSVGATATIKVDLNFGASFFWNIATKSFGLGLVGNPFTTAAADTWQRFEFTIPAEKFQAITATACWLRFTVDEVKTVILDAVQFEERQKASPYQPGRDDLDGETNVLTVYQGEVRRPEWKHNGITLQTQSNMGRRQREIPITLVSNRFSKTWDIPPESEGKPFPITMGNLFFKALGGDPASPGTIDRIDIGESVDVIPRQWPKSLAMGIMVNNSAGQREISSKAKVYFDRPDVVMNDMGLIYHYDEEADRYFAEMSVDNFPSASTYGWAKDPATSSAEAVFTDLDYLRHGRMPLSVYMRYQSDVFIQLTGNGGSWVDTWQMGRGNYQGRARARLFGAAAGSTQETHIAVELFKLSDIEIVDAYAIAQVEILGAHAPGASYIELWVGIGGVSPNYRKIRLQDGSGRFHNSPFSADDPVDTPTHGETAKKFTKDDQINRFDWWNTPTDGAGSTAPQHSKVLYSRTQADDEVYCHDLGVRLDVTINLQDFVPFAAVKGREYVGTWDSRKTAGLLIENFADIIEGLLRDELAVAGGGIATAKFDAANTARSAWKGAGQVVDVDRSENVIDQMAASSALVYFVDNDGKESVKALDFGTADKVLTLSDFREGSIVCTYTERENVINDFVLNYGRNPSTGEYQAQAWCNRHGSSLDDMLQVEKCQAAYDAIGEIENRREFFADWIQDRATAELLLVWLIDWLRFRRIRVKGEAWLSELDLELGDRVQLHEFVGYLPGTVESSRFVVERTALKKDDGTVGLSLLEVKDPAIVDTLTGWITAVETELTYTAV